MKLVAKHTTVAKQHNLKTTFRGRIQNGSRTQKNIYDLTKLCAKFHAFITKCRIYVLICSTTCIDHVGECAMTLLSPDSVALWTTWII